MADYENPENTLVLDTSKGEIAIELLVDVAPKHCERLKTLAGEGFYDGIVFHRVIEGFMAQVGCPLGTGTGGSEHPDLEQEFNDTPHKRGTCSMARTQDPNSANSQWFICFDEQSFLDGQYTVWGQVIAGMDVVDELSRGEPPRNPDMINSAKMASEA